MVLVIHRLTFLYRHIGVAQPIRACGRSRRGCWGRQRSWGRRWGRLRGGEISLISCLIIICAGGPRSLVGSPTLLLLLSLPFEDRGSCEDFFGAALGFIAGVADTRAEFLQRVKPHCGLHLKGHRWRWSCAGEKGRDGERKSCGGGARNLRLSAGVAPAVRRDATEFGGGAGAGTGNNLLLRRLRGCD